MWNPLRSRWNPGVRGLEVCRLVQPVRVVEDRFTHEKDLEIIGYRLRNAFGSLKAIMIYLRSLKKNFVKREQPQLGSQSLFFLPPSLSLCMATRSPYRPCSK